MEKSLLKKMSTKYMTKVPQAELMLSMKELGTTSFKLLMYYYSRNDGWVFVDKNIATSIGTSERMVKISRKELIDKKYLFVQKGKIDVYFIGKGALALFGVQDI